MRLYAHYKLIGMQQQKPKTVLGYLFVRIFLLLFSFGVGVCLISITDSNGLDGMRAFLVTTISIGFGSATGFVYFLWEAVSEKAQQRLGFKIISLIFSAFCFLLFTVICFLVNLTL